MKNTIYLLYHYCYHELNVVIVYRIQLQNITMEAHVAYVISVTKANAQITRDKLTQEGIYDPTRKIRHRNAAADDILEIPIITKGMWPMYSLRKQAALLH